MKESCHLAGIIPINSQPMDFNLPLPDCMISIAPDYLAIERAVLECATAGCHTIWLSCPLRLHPFLRKRLGESVQDPLYYNNKRDPRSHTGRREIPIYYIPVSPQDRDQRDSVMWNLLYACVGVSKICQRLSLWLNPKKFFICFPNAVYPSQWLLKRRKEIMKSPRFLVSFDQKTFLDGQPSSGTITPDEVKFLIQKFKEKATRMYIANEVNPTCSIPTRKLPLAERYSGRFLTIKDIFSELPEVSGTTFLKVKWFYPLTNWEEYCKYLSSEDRKTMKRPVRPLLRHQEWVGVANGRQIEYQQVRKWKK